MKSEWEGGIVKGGITVPCSEYHNDILLYRQKASQQQQQQQPRFVSEIDFVSRPSSFVGQTQNVKLIFNERQKLALLFNVDTDRLAFSNKSYYELAP